MPERNRLRGAGKHMILIADGDEINIRLLSRHLMGMGEIVACADGAAAVERTLALLPDILLLDVNMPVLDGYEACRKLKAIPATRDIPVIFITGTDGEDAETEAFSAGAVDFVSKPFRPAVIRARTEAHLELKGLRDSLENQVRERTRELQETQKEILRRLAMAAEYRDPDAKAHINRIRGVTALMCESLGMHERDVAEIAVASVLHDVGKIGVPDGILLKPARLTPEEFEIMKRHTTIGAELLDHLAPPVFRTALRIALTHHEKWDGTGYPGGLAGTDIPLCGRIVALCDVFDALTSDRPYKKAWTPDEAFAEIARGKGSHFDPDLTDLFLSLREAVLEICRERDDSGIDPFVI